MQLELSPPPVEGVTVAVARAVERAGVDLSDAPHAYVSPWRAAGLADAAERTPPAPVPHGGAFYSARSLRSTRGATRA